MGRRIIFSDAAGKDGSSDHLCLRPSRLPVAKDYEVVGIVDDAACNFWSQL